MKRKLVDLAERAGATFAQAFLAAITVNATGITELDAVKVAAVAGGYSVAKFLLVQARAYLESSELKTAEAAVAPVVAPPPAVKAPELEAKAPAKAPGGPVKFA